MISSDDYTLLKDFKSGKERAYEKVFYFFYPDFYIYAYTHTKSKEDAEDIVMTAFSKLFSMDKASFDGFNNVKYFLIRIIKNACLNYSSSKRQKIKDIKSFMNEPHEEYETFDFEFDLKPAIIRKLYKIIEDMPETRRQIFFMLLRDEKDPMEIAKQLGISRQTVYAQKNRALSDIKKLIQDEPGKNTPNTNAV